MSLARFVLRGITMLGLVVAADALAEDASSRLKHEQQQLREQLLKNCPAQHADIAALDEASPARRVELFQKLEPCGGKLEAFLIQQGSAFNLVGHYAEAEATYRRAMKLRVTEAAQIGLMTALVRQPSLTQSQKSDLESNLDYFRQRDCSRDDLCAGLSYVAWHADDFELTKRSGERAIRLKFPGWQPYFTAGTVYSNGSATDSTRAVELLREAKARGGPADAIDGFLVRLGADPGSSTADAGKSR